MQITSELKILETSPYLGWRSSPKEAYKWIGYHDAEKIIHTTGSAFIELGLVPKTGEKVGLYARNRPEVSATHPRSKF